MKKLVFITESQKRTLLREEVSDRMEKIISSNYDLVKKIITKTQEQTNLDLKFLVTWGAAIGGMIGPLNSFIESNNPNISEDEICLILTAITLIFYHESKSSLKKLEDLIKEKNLESVFDSSLEKANELKQVFVSFIESLNVTIHRSMNIMSYTFIIPVIPLILNLSHGNITDQDIIILSKRILGFGLVAFAGNALRELISKMIKRFRGE